MATSSSGRTALIIGASRGIGLGLVKEYARHGWRVVGTVRGGRPGPLRALAAESSGAVEVEEVDITDERQIEALRKRLEGRSFDLLFVNAGVTNDPSEPIGKVSTEEFNRVMDTNALAPMRVVERLEHLVAADGTIGVMSSILGSVGANDDGGWEVYRASKAALNTLMRSFAARHAAERRRLLIMHPGWVRTDMGGAGAHLSVEESVAGLYTTMTAQASSPGLRYLDYRGRTIPW